MNKLKLARLQVEYTRTRVPIVHEPNRGRLQATSKRRRGHEPTTATNNISANTRSIESYLDQASPTSPPHPAPMAATTPSELEHKAKEAFFDDDFALAAALYTQAIAAGAPAAALYADRAQAYIKMGDFAAAAADAARAAELDPAMPRAHLRRAHACVKLEQYDAARAAVEAGAALAPNDARFAQLMKEIDSKAPKPMETDASPAAAATPVPATAPAEKPKYRHDYYNSAAEVVVTVFAKGVAPEHVAVEFGEQLLSVSVEVPGEVPYHLQPRLFGKIIPDKCRFAVLSTKIEVRLAKAEPGTTWTSLEFIDKPRFIAAAPPSGSSPAAAGGARRPSYPSSKGRKDWDKIEAEVKKAEKEEKLDGDAAANRFFQDIFSNADEDMRRAMTKSFQESNGTVLSTNWKDVGSKKIEPSPPEGMDLRKWEY
ncbi:protein SGT1 homolog [Setaria viridis]|nr:protein SGT1 homolog [Setaria viridis]